MAQLAGAYPAWIFRFPPCFALRTKASATVPQAWCAPRWGVVTQFAVSIGLGISGFGGVRANLLARAIDLGLDKDGVVVLRANAMTFSAKQGLV